MRMRRLAAVLSVSLTVGAMTLPAVAVEEVVTEPETTVSESDADYSYYLDDNDMAVIDTYTGSDSDVVIPDQLDGHDVYLLDDDAFNGHDEITSVTIPATLQELGDSVFYGCTGLEEFKVADGNSCFDAVDGVLYSSDGIYLYAYPEGKTQDIYVMQEGVQEIWGGAFAKSTLEEVDFCGGLLYVDDWAFAYSEIQTLELPASVVEIGQYAFSYCTRLTEVEFPADLEVIEEAAFGGCVNLGSITLNDGLTDVGMAAFAGCGFDSVHIPSSVDEIGYCAFGYKEDLTSTIYNFVIYAASGSQGQAYCTDSDEENDYENNFTYLNESLMDDDSADEDVAVATSTTAKETTPFQKYARYGLLGALVVILLGGGLFLVFGDKKKAKKDKKNKKSKQTEETTPVEPTTSEEDDTNEEA